MWRELFELTYRHVRKLGASHADAEELAQEVLMAAYVNIEGIDPDKLLAWLRAAARNKLVDLYRRSAKTVSLETAAGMEDFGDVPEAAAVREDECRQLRRAIGRLPPRDALLLEQYYLEERPLSCIANDQGMSVSAAKVALFRARRRLKQALETQEEP